MNEYLAVFPGREAFYKGLSPSFYMQYDVVKRIFNEASDLLNEDIAMISYGGDIKRKPILHTACLITHCYAMYKILLKTIYDPYGVAGFSQGEFTALTAAGCLKYPDVLMLVYELERLAYESQTIRKGKMVRVVGLEIDELEKCCREADEKGEMLAVAIYLSKDQNIISGERNAVDEVVALAKKRGARWAIDLESPGAFHSPLCQSVLSHSDEIFDKYEFFDPVLPVFSCIDGQGYVNAGILKDNLKVQIAKAVKWNAVIQNVAAKNINHIVEIGPGCTVSGNSRLVQPDLKCTWINTVKDMKTQAKSIGWAARE